MDIGAANVEAFSPACIGVDLKLETVVVVGADRGLVVEDGKSGRDAALLVEDHVGSTGDGDPRQVQLKRTFCFPDSVQIVLMVPCVRRYEALGGGLEVPLGRLVRGGQEKA